MERQYLTGPASPGLNVVSRPGEGLSLVLIHGFTDSWSSYEPIIAELPSAVPVIAYDLRGHGGSARTPGAYTLREHLRDAAAVLEAAVVGRAVLCGHSLGGVIAACLAAEQPERVAGLILEDTFFPDDVGSTEFVAWREQLTALAGQPREAWAQQVGHWPYGEGRTRQDYFGADGVWRQVGHWMQLDLAHMDALIDRSLWGQPRPDEAATLGAIRCPTAHGWVTRGGQCDHRPR
jgi:pimeloyl-ACP methyl ester carboxylesterase